MGFNSVVGEVEKVSLVLYRTPLISDRFVEMLLPVAPVSVVVVVAWDRNPGRGKFLDECFGFGEFFWKRRRSEVAAEEDRIDPNRTEQGGESVDRTFRKAPSSEEEPISHT